MGNEGQDNTAKVIQLEDYDRSLGTDELNLAEFPLASLATRTAPGQNTLLFEDTIFDEGANAHVNRSLVIAGSDHFGLPTSTDSDILLLLVHLSNVRNGFKSKRVEFSRYELIKFLGWPLDGRSYKRLDESLQRWTSVTLHYKHAWWQRSGQKWRSRSFHVLETLELRAKDEIHDDGLSSFTWNEVIFESFNSGNLRRIDLGVYFKLKLSTSRQMYRFLDKRFYRTGRLVFNLKQFATEHIGLSRNYDCYEIKRKLSAAIRELESIGFLRKLSDTERYEKLSAGKWEIRLEKGQGKLSSPDSPEQKIVKELKIRGVSERTAQELASKFPVERIEGKISLHDELLRASDKRISRNPAGFLAAAIRHDYANVPSRVPRLKDSSNRNRNANSNTKRDKPNAKTDPADESFQVYWNALPIDEQAKLEREAMNSAPKFHRDTIQRLDLSSSDLKVQMRMRLVRDYIMKAGKD